jgi:hypothetical protein
MGNDVEELLRDGMRRTTVGVRMAPDLAGRLAGQAARKHRRWLLTRAGAAGGTALAALAVAAGFAVAGAVTTAPGATIAPRVQTAAYVIGQANHALASEPALAQVSWTLVDGTGHDLNVTTGWLYNQSPQRGEQVRYFSGRLQAVKMTRYTSGRDSWVTVTRVDYQDRTWWTQTFHPAVAWTQAAHAAASPSCPSPGLVSVYASPIALRQLVACGDYAIEGRPRVDGVPTIELALVKIGNVKLAAGKQQTIWVNAATYLPVRIVRGPPNAVRVQVDLRWLPVTPANLAHLTLHIPAGFKHTSGP